MSLQLENYTLSMNRMCIITYVLNLFDMFFTLYALSLGGKELNPFMQNTHFMIFYKIVIMGILLWWLSKRPERVARLGLILCMIVYSALFVYHIVGLFRGFI